jgi:hypothetical protein
MGKTKIKEEQINVDLPDPTAYMRHDRFPELSAGDIKDDKETRLLIWINDDPGVITLRELRGYLGI